MSGEEEVWGRKGELWEEMRGELRLSITSLPSGQLHVLTRPTPKLPHAAQDHLSALALDDRLLVVPWKPLRVLRRTGRSLFCQCLDGTNRLAAGFNCLGQRGC